MTSKFIVSFILILSPERNEAISVNKTQWRANHYLRSVSQVANRDSLRAEVSFATEHMCVRQLLFLDCYLTRFEYFRFCDILFFIPHCFLKSFWFAWVLLIKQEQIKSRMRLPCPGRRKTAFWAQLCLAQTWPLNQLKVEIVCDFSMENVYPLSHFARSAISGGDKWVCNSAW